MFLTLTINQKNSVMLIMKHFTNTYIYCIQFSPPLVLVLITPSNIEIERIKFSAKETRNHNSKLYLMEGLESHNQNINYVYVYYHIPHCLQNNFTLVLRLFSIEKHLTYAMAH